MAAGVRPKLGSAPATIGAGGTDGCKVRVLSPAVAITGPRVATYYTGHAEITGGGNHGIETTATRLFATNSATRSALVRNGAKAQRARKSYGVKCFRHTSTRCVVKGL